MDNVIPLNAIAMLSITELQDCLEVCAYGVKDDTESDSSLFWMLFDETGDSYVKDKTMEQAIAELIAVGFVDGGCLIDVDFSEEHKEANIVMFTKSRVVYHPDMVDRLHQIKDDEWFYSTTAEKESLKAFLTSQEMTIVGVTEVENGQTKLISTEGWP